jgi:hypothetical protein
MEGHIYWSASPVLGCLPKETGHVDTLLAVIADSVKPRKEDVTWCIDMLMLGDQTGKLLMSALWKGRP